MALIGLSGAISTNRTIVANNYLSNLGQLRIEGALNFMQMCAQFGSSGAVCRVFVPSSVLPPPEEMQKLQQEFDEQCAWFKKVVDGLQKLDPNNPVPININNLACERPTGGENWVYKSFEESVASYNQALDRVTLLEEEMQLSIFEQLLQILSPSILVIALALRITKVTGEVALERAKNQVER